MSDSERSLTGELRADPFFPICPALYPIIYFFLKKSLFLPRICLLVFIFCLIWDGSERELLHTRPIARLAQIKIMKSPAALKLEHELYSLDVISLTLSYFILFYLSYC